ncbi:MAG TPA: Zn-ribbon domain-containing OB-fold protein [Chloroflexota bacterium]|nr:Zn-ribbon domain-containing OB-fold protein [Chloroflexota bacterium]
MSVRIQDFPGTPLREDDVRSGRVLTVSGAARAEYAWDLGVAMTRYLEELRNGRLVGQRCRHCGRVLFPPRAFCEQCFCPTTEWVALPDTGVIQTFAICHIAWDAQRIDEPKLPAVIAVDGASRNMGLLHLIGGVEPERVAVGQRVRAVWRPPDERQGAITDILYFTPTEA